MGINWREIGDGGRFVPAERHVNDGQRSLAVRPDVFVNAVARHIEKSSTWIKMTTSTTTVVFHLGFQLSGPIFHLVFTSGTTTDSGIATQTIRKRTLTEDSLKGF